MRFSSDTEHVLTYLDEKSGQGLRKRNDVGVLLELAAVNDAHEAINELAFNGSFLFKVYQTLKKSSPGSDGYRTLEREFGAAVENVRQQIATLLVGAEEEHVERFNTQYYQMSQGSLRNIVDLAHDFGVLKSVQNEQKYGGGDTGESGDQSDDDNRDDDRSKGDHGGAN